MQFSPRRYARMIKRAGRLLTGHDVLYRYDAHPRKITLGSVYGGWTIAPEFVTPGGVMYSFGVGDDISFDEAAIERFQLQVHGFDPSPNVIEWIRSRNLPPNYIFHPYGLAEVDGSVSFFSPEKSGGMYSTSGQHGMVTNNEERLPVKKLETIMADLKADCLEIAKLDIEGAEYGVIHSIIECNVPIRQLLIEFHHRLGVEPLQATIDAVNRLKENGFLLFHVSETSSEFSFLHRSLMP